MNLNQQLTIQQKYQYIIQHQYLFTPQHIKNIKEIQSYLLMQNHNTPIVYSKLIQLQTFYKCTLPAYHNLHWQSQINFKVQYPVVCIIAFKQLNQNNYCVQMKISSWAQSGGVRLFPIKANTSEQKLRQLIKNSNGMIIPQFEGQIEQNIFIYINEIIKQNSEYPILALGNSALFLMNKITNNKQLRQKSRYDLKFRNFQTNVFLSHKDPLFYDLDLNVRLQIENKQKIMSSSVHLPVHVFDLCKNECMQLIGIGKGRMDEWGVIAVRQKLVHFCFIDPRPNINFYEGILLNHKLIINFMQQIRKRQNNIINDKIIQLGQYKVYLKQDRFYYNIDIKLNKI